MNSESIPLSTVMPPSTMLIPSSSSTSSFSPRLSSLPSQLVNAKEVDKEETFSSHVGSEEPENLIPAEDEGVLGLESSSSP